MNIEECQHCQQPFRLEEHISTPPVTKTRQPIHCPYCGFTTHKTSKGSWSTVPLDDEEIKRYTTQRK